MVVLHSTGPSLVGDGMSFDPMAAAIDWLDAYRAADIDSILEMYAENAVVHCGCGGMKTFTGREALRAYFTDLVQKYPASDLDDLHPSAGGPAISYVTTTGVVTAVFAFDADGKIKTLNCAPSSRTSAQRDQLR